MARHRRLHELSLGALLGPSWLLISSLASAQTSQSSSYTLYPAHDNRGSGDAGSTNFGLETTVGEPVAIQRTYSGGRYQLGAGLQQIIHYPNVPVNFQALDLNGVSTVTLTFNSPGYDGANGALQPGASYFVVLATYTSPNPFFLNNYTLVSATAGVQPGVAVSAAAAALASNTTFYLQMWTLDADGNASFASPQATGTTLAAQPVLTGQPFASVYDTSVTVTWQPFPSSPQSASAEGYVLEASSTNFGANAPGGLIYGATTHLVTDSQITVGGGMPLDYCTTYYFRLASLNWRDQKDYVLVGATPTATGQGVQVSTHDLDIGNVLMGASVVVSTSFLVLNTGNCPVDYLLSAQDITAGTPWTIGPSASTDTLAVAGAFNPSTPSLGSFAAQHYMTSMPVRADSVRFAMGQTGAAVPRGQARLVWVRLDMPPLTSTADPQQVRFTVQTAPPP